MFDFTLSERCFVAGQICRKFTHFPSVKFPGLKMCECKKMTNIRYVPGSEVVKVVKAIKVVKAAIVYYLV